MTLGDYLLLLRRSWLLVILAAMLGVAGGLFLSRSAAPSYSSGATVVVKVATDGSTGSLLSSGDFAVRRASTYAALVTTGVVLTPAAAQTGDALAELQQSVNAAVRPDSAIIDISAQAPTAELAAGRATAVAESLSVQGSALDTFYPGGPVQIEVVTEASVPSGPDSPGAVNFIVIGLVVGSALGVAGVVVRNSLDDRLRSPADLPRTLTFSSVTSLPLARRTGPWSVDNAPRTEAFRRLRSTLDFVATGGGIVSVMGSNSGGATRAVVDDLAAALGEVGYGVVVLDVDFHRAVKKGATERSGVAEVLRGEAEVADVIQETPDGTSRIHRGEGDERTAQLLGTTQMYDLLASLSRTYTFVLLWCPPVRTRAESAVLAAMSAEVLLVIDAGTTRRRQLMQALELLAGLGVKNISLVVDRVRRGDLGRVSSFGVEAPRRPAGGRREAERA